jgi:hypothetical protein
LKINAALWHTGKKKFNLNIYIHLNSKVIREHLSHIKSLKKININMWKITLWKIPGGLEVLGDERTDCDGPQKMNE